MELYGAVDSKSIFNNNDQIEILCHEKILQIKKEMKLYNLRISKGKSRAQEKI